jgi:UDP-N-acetylglucosamine diphosphorylase / glucose-1-phosphate thymidylyltransferase / UDP-N-acetylgalactosamine diphosphorylase / glucosamine-1-phosphate N-acetyltransferase / galactosamine-1-phosphate N-acetyltransferase
MIIVYEDSGVDALAPITTGRLAYVVNCGGYTLIELLLDLAAKVGKIPGESGELVGVTRPYLQAIQEADYPAITSIHSERLSPTARPTLLINARLLPAMSYIAPLVALLSNAANNTLTSNGAVIMNGDQVAVVVRPPWSVEQIRQAGYDGLPDLVQSASSFAQIDLKMEVVRWPHEIIAHHMALLGNNLEYRLKQGGYEQLQDGLFVAPGVKLGDYLAVETKAGPIVIDRDAQVGPYTLLRGPVYMGPKCKILEHAAIKDAVSLGHTTKIGGEVEASIVEPYSNKQHHGFLGHSYLGSWINLGAGTCNSDLKNTYGTVNMEYPAGKATTGMQFLGCVMGNYSKSAINTGIFTGKVIGACSMMYGFVTSNVPSFVNYARLFGQVTTLPPEVMVATQARMFSRRQVKQRHCDVQLIHDMYRLTQDERDRCTDLLSL